MNNIGQSLQPQFFKQLLLDGLLLSFEFLLLFELLGVLFIFK